MKKLFEQKENGMFKILMEQRKLSVHEINFLKEIANTFLKTSKTNNKKSLETHIYDYYIREHDSYERAMSLYKDPNLKKQWDEYWNKVKEAVKETGLRRGWQYHDEGVWTQFTKPFSGSYQHGSGNFKRYLTFKRGNNLEDLLENFKKIPYLLKNINDAKTIGKVSFKMSSYFGPLLSDKDNIVIHYKEQEDSDSIEKAVKDTDFILMDRQQIGRTDTGVDTSTSDSKLVASEAAEDMLGPNKDLLINYLSSKEQNIFMQGIELMNNILSQNMEKAKHRNK